MGAGGRVLEGRAKSWAVPGRGVRGRGGAPVFVAPCQLHCNKSGAAAPPACARARPPPAVADMESVASNIQVLLQAAEFLERRERGEADPLAGPQAATLLRRAWVRRGSQLEGCIHGFNAVAPGHPRLKMERSPRSVGLGGCWGCGPGAKSLSLTVPCQGRPLGPAAA